MNKLDNFYNVSSYNDTTGKLTLIAPNGNTTTLDIYKTIDINDESIKNKPLLSNIDDVNGKKLVDGSILIDSVNNISYYKRNGILEPIYANRNIEGFRIKYWDKLLAYPDNSIVSFNDSFFKSSVAASTTIGKIPTIVTESFDFTGEGDIVDLGLVGITGIYAIDSIYYVTTTSGVFKSENGLDNLEVVTSRNSMHKYCDMYGNQMVMEENDIIAYNNKYARIEYRYTFPNEIRAFFTSNNKLYVLFHNDSYIYKYEFMNNEYVDKIQVLLPDDYDDTTIDGSITTGRIVLTSDGSNKIVVHNIAENIDTIFESSIGNSLSSTINDEYIYIVDTDNAIHKYNIISSEWIQIELSDMFANTKCPENYDIIKIYEDIVDESNDNIIQDFMNEPQSCALYRNKYLFISENSFRGRIFRYNFRNGIDLFNPEDFTFKDIYPYYGSNIVGTAIFNGKLIVALGSNQTKLIELDVETLEVLSTTDISVKINGDDIVSMNTRGDTIYVLTSANKVYKFSDISGEPVGTIYLSKNMDNASICALDSNRLWVSNRYNIYEFDLNSGVGLAKIKIDTKAEVAMSITLGGMYMLDIKDSRNKALTRYRSTDIRKYKWSY